MKLGVVGLGPFAENFIPLFVAHPSVAEVVLCDLDVGKLAEGEARHGLTGGLPTFDALLESDVDAVAIFTQHWSHAPLAVRALDAGKHVYSAVPPAVSVDEVTALVGAVERSGRHYMLGETSYYYPETVYCRQRHQAGDFGGVVHARAEYWHDWDTGLYLQMQRRHGEGWRDKSGDPPLYYPTHSAALVMSVTGAHATHVSAQGFVDNRPEDADIYDPGNPWGNRFSNETAALRMSDGSTAQFNEFRRIGYPPLVRFSMYGTAASFEEGLLGALWTDRNGKPEPLDELFDATTGISLAHDADRLPPGLVRPNGFFGSPAFLVDDFVVACVTDTVPPNNVWDAARYMLPGLVGHESAMQGGVLLEVPDFGPAPR